ncbi:MAG TPA: restriction endonuclease subunit S, partial [Nitrospira sp.]|nr:restriction endonuclease subunit S [Nitrospira sp.]
MTNRGWEYCRWGDLAALEYGKALRGYAGTNNGRYRVFGTNGPIGWHDKSLFPGPGVIVGRKGAYRGIYFSAEPCWVIDTAFYLKVRNSDRIDPRFAYYQLKTVNLDDIDSGSAIPSTSRAAFYEIPVAVPPLRTQSKIAAVLSAYDYLIENNNRRIKILEEIAKRIYQEWFVDFRYPGHENVSLVNSELGP